MIKSIEVTGKTEEEALASALQQLGLSRDDVSMEVIQRAKSGFLGIGAAPVILKVSYEIREETQEDKVRTFLSGLLDHMGVEADIEITTRENGGLDVSLNGDNMGALIGRRGRTLDAIQHLTNYSVNKGSEKRMHINVDAEDYRSKREESLVHLAEKMAAKAIKYRRSMALEPMNSYERHIIHTALQDYEGVTTSSIGTEPNRRVVVSYVKPENGTATQRSSAPKSAPAAAKSAPASVPSANSVPSASKPVVKEWS
jgi:spoIIIJ-associated protein